MESLQVATGDGRCDVRVGGPQSAHVVVVLLRASDDPEAVYDDVCERLHNSGLRTVVIGAHDHRLTERSVLAVLDELSLAWVNLVGNKDGADVAWLLAARTFGRFVSLVVMDRGHPAIADGQGQVLAEDCPAVEMPTTVLMGDPDNRDCAELSGRRVYSEFRVVQLPDGADVASASSELATEIVLRTSSW